MKNKHFFISLPVDTSTPIYKRKYNVLKKLDELKQQLKEEGFSKTEYKLKNMTCFGLENKKAVCTFEIKEPIKEGYSWLPREIDRYKRLLQSEGDINNLNKLDRQKVKTSFSEGIPIEEQYEKIKGTLDFLKDTSCSNLHIPPFKGSNKSFEKEKRFVSLIEREDIKASQAKEIMALI